jgi:hypothetical protein
MEIKINGLDLYELNLSDLEKAQEEIQKYIDEKEEEEDKRY